MFKLIIEKETIEELKIYQQAPGLHSVLWEFGQYLRGIRKYSEDEEEIRVGEKIEQTFFSTYE